MFKTKLKNVGIKFGSRSILREALMAYQGLFPGFKAQKIRDEYGTIAFRVGNIYLVAKKKPYGDIVSVHKKVWDGAKGDGTIIVMYLQSSGYFYRFDPSEIGEMSVNERGGAKMVNFDIRNGTNLMKAGALKRKVEAVVQRNLEKGDEYWQNFYERYMR